MTKSRKQSYNTDTPNRSNLTIYNKVESDLKTGAIYVIENN